MKYELLDDIKHSVLEHVRDLWPLYVLWAVATSVLICTFQSINHEISQPPEIIVVDGCEYIRPRGQSLIIHKANCKNH